MKRCPKTLSGKHIWKTEKMVMIYPASGSATSSLLETGFVVCHACGLYDDRPKREGKK